MRGNSDATGTRPVSDERFVSLYVTVPALAEAERIGTALVEERLAACVNIVPGVVSLYSWEGALQRDDEVLLFAKTPASLAVAARERIVALHGHDVPCVLTLPIEDGHPAYLAWLASRTGPEGGAPNA